MKIINLKYLFLLTIFVINVLSAKNIILFISDGCGYNHIEAASFYQYGEKNKQVYQEFPVQYAMSTYSQNNPQYNNKKAWESFDYVIFKPTDSAASGTALATGVKTLNGKVGVDTNNAVIKNAVEHFESIGKSTGVVTSVPFAHATPATFVTHDTLRNNYSEIARNMLRESAIDVIMGGGHPYYDEQGKFTGVYDYMMVGGPELWKELLSGKLASDANGDSHPDFWEFIDDRSDFQAFAYGPAPVRVIGIPKTMGSLQVGRVGDEHAGAFEVPFNENVPTLVEMTLAAINILDDDEEGFFLMVEGGAVDWASHGNLSGRMIEEEIDFNNSVEAVVEWVKKNSSWDETTIIVTADHETGYLTGPGSNDSTAAATGLEIWKPLINNGKGNMPGMEWHSDKHTNSLVPFFAKGRHADKFKDYIVNIDPVRGAYIDNANVGQFLLSITD
ncbi:MAG: alkaline phosphatase [Calditrichaceae bacterium]|nr:alkaline phosphatase [Calditrichaceae bacterium]